MTVRQRYLLLLALRWFATGLIIPASLLLPLSRGLSLAEIGTAMAAQGAVVLLLEVPSGALTDAWGRRPVFISSALVAAVAYLAMLTAQSMWAFMLAWGLCGVFRALDSGPLEAWFVDAEHDRGAHAGVPSALASASSVIAASIAVGSLTSSAVLAAAPWPTTATLAVPYAVAAIVVMAQAACAVMLMDTTARDDARPHATWGSSLRDGVRLALSPHVRILTGAMVLVGIGVMALETFMPVRLEEFSGDAATAGSAMGLVTAGAWGLGSLGAAATSRLLRRAAPPTMAAALVAVEAVGLVIMAVALGPTLLIAGFWLCYLVHSGFGSTYNSLVHARVDERHRGTVLSVTSMAFLGSASAAGIALTATAEQSSSSVALVIGAGALLAAAVLVWAGGHRFDGRRQGSSNGATAASKRSRG